MIWAGAELPERLPLFPLSGAILLPRAILPLHIFEPRYLQMVEDVLKTPGRLIGMMQRVTDDDDSPLAQIGMAGRIVEFSENDDGRMMISLRAVSRFTVDRVEDGFTPYLLGHVNWDNFSHDLGRSETDPDWDRAGFMKLLQKFMALHELGTDWDTAAEAEDEMLINSLAMALPLEVGEKQALLETQSLTERRVLLEGLLEYHLREGPSEEFMH